MTYEELQLDKIPVAVHRLITDEAIELFGESEVLWREVLNGMMIELRTAIVAEQVATDYHDVEFEAEFIRAFPASPWQHAKQRWAPDWFLARWPVHFELDTQTYQETRRVWLDQFRLFPDAKIRTPEKLRGERVVHFTRFREGDAC